MGGQGNEEKICPAWFCRSMVTVFAILVTAATALTVFSDFHFKWHKVHNHPGPINRKYALALEVALQFFDVQKCMSTAGLVWPRTCA